MSNEATIVIPVLMLSSGGDVLVETVMYTASLEYAKHCMCLGMTRLSHQHDSTCSA
jgi:hypothetical protein